MKRRRPLAVWDRLPEVAVSVAFQGPRETWGRTGIDIVACWVGARVTAPVLENGPALRPVRARLNWPATSTARPPVLVTAAVTSWCPALSRPARRSLTAKSDAGSASPPIDRYMRRPTRLTLVTPWDCVGG